MIKSQSGSKQLFGILNNRSVDPPAGIAGVFIVEVVFPKVTVVLDGPASAFP